MVNSAFYDFCGFWSVAINSVYKLFFTYICNMLRATETGDRPSCRIDDGLEMVNQAGQKTSQCHITTVIRKCLQFIAHKMSL